MCAEPCPACPDELLDFVRVHPGLLVLTGAGISVPSGISTWRDDAGRWQRNAPIQHRDFLRSAHSRRRYWARSFVGWPLIEAAVPNVGHHALATLERSGHVMELVTQNIDGLHQRAGQQSVVELHGGLREVVCLDCGGRSPRSVLQERLSSLNPQLLAVSGQIAADGDADVAQEMVGQMQVPGCERCGGVLMPDVVFFGGSVPRERVAHVHGALERAAALLVVGTSLMVYSGFRFVRAAAEAGMPVAIVNRGRTRAEALATLRVRGDCAGALDALARQFV